MKYLNFYLKYFIAILSIFILGMLFALTFTYFYIQTIIGIIIIIFIMAKIYFSQMGKIWLKLNHVLEIGLIVPNPQLLDFVEKPENA